MAVIHNPGHQKEDTEVARGNNLADQTVKEAAKGTFIINAFGTFSRLVTIQP